MSFWISWQNKQSGKASSMVNGTASGCTSCWYQTLQMYLWFLVSKACSHDVKEEQSCIHFKNYLQKGLQMRCFKSTSTQGICNAAQHKVSDASRPAGGSIHTDQTLTPSTGSSYRSGFLSVFIIFLLSDPLLHLRIYHVSCWQFWTDSI